jgi:glutaryl-CoA dehydrogenase
LNRNESYDRNIYYEFGKQGLIGAGLSWNNNDPISSTASGLICKEVERVDSSFRSMLSVQSSLVAWPIHTYGTEQLKKRVLDKLISGEFVGCFGLTEPDHGSDPGSMATTARKDVILKPLSNLFIFLIGEFLGFKWK